MIYVVVMNRLIGLPLLIHTELLWRIRSRSLKIEESESELLCTDCTALLETHHDSAPSNHLPLTTKQTCHFLWHYSLQDTCEPAHLSRQWLWHGTNTHSGVRCLPGIIVQTGLSPTQRPIQCLPRTSSSGVKRPRDEVDHSPPAGTEVKNVSSYTSIPPYAFILQSVIKHMDKFHLTRAIQLNGSGLGASQQG
jgi:hypothetical protein